MPSSAVDCHVCHSLDYNPNPSFLHGRPAPRKRPSRRNSTAGLATAQSHHYPDACPGGSVLAQITDRCQSLPGSRSNTLTRLNEISTFPEGGMDPCSCNGLRASTHSLVFSHPNGGGGGHMDIRRQSLARPHTPLLSSMAMPNPVHPRPDLLVSSLPEGRGESRSNMFSKHDYMRNNVFAPIGAEYNNDYYAYLKGSKFKNSLKKHKFNLQTILLIGCYTLLFAMAVIVAVIVCYQNGWLGFGTSPASENEVDFQDGSTSASGDLRSANTVRVKSSDGRFPDHEFTLRPTHQETEPVEFFPRNIDSSGNPRSITGSNAQRPPTQIIKQDFSAVQDREMVKENHGMLSHPSHKPPQINRENIRPQVPPALNQQHPVQLSTPHNINVHAQGDFRNRENERIVVAEENTRISGSPRETVFVTLNSNQGSSPNLQNEGHPSLINSNLSPVRPHLPNNPHHDAGLRQDTSDILLHNQQVSIQTRDELNTLQHHRHTPERRVVPQNEQRMTHTNSQLNTQDSQRQNIVRTNSHFDAQAGQETPRSNSQFDTQAGQEISHSNSQFDNQSGQRQNIVHRNSHFSTPNGQNVRINSQLDTDLRNEHNIPRIENTNGHNPHNTHSSRNLPNSNTVNHQSSQNIKIDNTHLRQPQHSSQNTPSISIPHGQTPAHNGELTIHDIKNLLNNEKISADELTKLINDHKGQSEKNLESSFSTSQTTGVLLPTFHESKAELVKESNTRKEQNDEKSRPNKSPISQGQTFSVIPKRSFLRPQIPDQRQENNFPVQNSRKTVPQIRVSLNTKKSDSESAKNPLGSLKRPVSPQPSNSEGNVQETFLSQDQIDAFLARQILKSISNEQLQRMISNSDVKLLDLKRDQDKEVVIVNLDQFTGNGRTSQHTNPSKSAHNSASRRPTHRNSELPIKSNLNDPLQGRLSTAKDNTTNTENQSILNTEELQALLGFQDSDGSKVADLIRHRLNTLLVSTSATGRSLDLSTVKDTDFNDHGTGISLPQNNNENKNSLLAHNKEIVNLAADSTANFEAVIKDNLPLSPVAEVFHSDVPLLPENVEIAELLRSSTTRGRVALSSKSRDPSSRFSSRVGLLDDRSSNNDFPDAEKQLPNTMESNSHKKTNSISLPTEAGNKNDNNVNDNNVVLGSKNNDDSSSVNNHKTNNSVTNLTEIEINVNNSVKTNNLLSATNNNAAVTNSSFSVVSNNLGPTITAVDTKEAKPFNEATTASINRNFPNIGLNDAKSLNIASLSEKEKNESKTLEKVRVSQSSTLRLPSISLNKVNTVSGSERTRLPGESKNSLVIRSWQHMDSDGTLSHGRITSDGSFQFTNCRPAEACEQQSVFP